MTTSRPTRRTLAVAATAMTAVLALAGCSNDGGGGSSSGATEWTPGPLDEIQARIYGYSLDDQRSDEELQEENDRQNRRVEELVAACMQDEGFEYTPAENSGTIVSSSDDLDVEYGTVAFAEEYGYGISTDPWGYADMPSDDANEWVDPNQEYVESLSETAATAYQEALWGPSVEYVEGEEPQEYDWTTAGCYGSAQHEVYEGGDTSEEYAGLEDELNRFYESVQSDPRTVELEDAWASCMADAGFDGLTSMQEATEPLYEEWNGMQGWDDPEYVAAQESWDWEAEPEGPPAPEVDEAALAAFTAKEIEQATADFGCQEQVEYTKKSIEINHELQQDFVDEHGAELEAWAAAAEQARGK
ncbi:hypothetical protein [Cellulomonas triticagri]|uniref:Uncharacterized protein n=1 Tax=Cellulomonas triticagri TaxID=2483352 RepID=A0A3M2J719_9CELL|nr:hypothetical protein [Cellulomonas triticagri]RMI06735.1 hypothetical protein EBM89_15355 [Cellulomonas triticagri]